MNLALRTGMYGDMAIDEVAAAVAEAGYDAVHLDLDLWRLTVADGGLTEALAERIGDQFERVGVVVAAVGVQVPLVQGAAAAAPLLEVMRVADALGTDLVVTTAGNGDDWTPAIECLEKVMDSAEERQVELVVELGPNMAIRDLDQAEPLLEAVPSDLLSLSLDLGWVAERHGLGEQEVLERIGDALAVVTLSEPDAAGHAAAPSPTGAARLDSVFAALRREAPDVTVVAGGVTPANAAAVRSYLARFL